jgi:hypothetical protein
VALSPFWGLNDKGQTPNEEPTYFSDPWDTFYINGDQLPGYCEVINKDVAQVEVEKKKGKNSAGATITILGYEPGSFDVVCRIVTPAQWEAFQQIRRKYWAGPTKKTKPPALTVTIGHPDLNSLNVTRAVIIGVPLAEKSDVEGAKNFRLRFHEESKKVAKKAIDAAGVLPPEDPRQPAAASLNTPEDPAANPENTSLAGPPKGSAQ